MKIGTYIDKIITKHITAYMKKNSYMKFEEEELEDVRQEAWIYILERKEGNEVFKECYKLFAGIDEFSYVEEGEFKKEYAKLGGYLDLTVLSAVSKAIHKVKQLVTKKYKKDEEGKWKLIKEKNSIYKYEMQEIEEERIEEEKDMAKECDLEAFYRNFGGICATMMGENKEEWINKIKSVKIKKDGYKDKKVKAIMTMIREGIDNCQKRKEEKDIELAKWMWEGLCLTKKEDMIKTKIFKEFTDIILR